MANFYTCPYCGANLDHGERCDCSKENAASGATNTQSGEKQDQSPEKSCDNDTTFAFKKQ